MRAASLATLLLLAAGPALADPAVGLAAGQVVAPADLPPAEAVHSVLDNHPTVTAGAARVGAARAHEAMLRRGSAEFQLGGTFARRSIDREGTLNDFDATLSRPFRLPGKAALDRQTGELGVAVAINRQADLRHQTARLLADLWYAWLTAAAHYRNDLTMIRDLEQARTAIERRVTLRDAALLDLDQARSALAQAQTQAANSLARREQAHATLVATFPDLPVPAEAPEPAVPAIRGQPLEAMRDAVIAHSHEITAADKEAQRLDTLARRVRADRIADPSFGVRLFSERSGTETGAGIIASMPLGGGYRRAAADQAAAEAGAARMEMVAIERTVRATANADLASARAYYAAWQSADLAAHSAAEAASRMARGHQLGQIDLAELLYARRLAGEARRAEIDARSAANQALTRLMVDSHSIWTAADPDEDHSDH